MILGIHQELDRETNATIRAKCLQIAKNVGATVSRGGLSWKRINTADGVYDWTLSDTYLAECEAAGLTRLMTLIDTPQWVSGNSDSGWVPGAGSATDPAFLAWVEAFAKFAAAAVARYKGRKVLWEIWNEPTIQAFWRPNPSGAQYGVAAMTIKEAMLAVDPTAQVAVGSIFDWRGNNGKAFTAQAIAAGLRSDIWSVKGYFDDPKIGAEFGKDWSDQLRLYEDLVRSANGPARLWVTEWGALVPSFTPTAQQRQDVADQFTYCLNTAPQLPAEMHVVFVDYDRLVQGSDPDPLTGLYRQLSSPSDPLVPWPAAGAVAAASVLFDGKFDPRREHPSKVASGALSNITGTSPITYTNTDPYSQVIAIVGGTVTSVTLRRGSDVPYTLAAGNTNVRMAPGDVLTITYTAAPTITKIPDA